MKGLLIPLVLAGLLAATQIGAGASARMAPTFSHDIASIVFNKCAICHRPGEVAPMPLTSYAEVRPWSKAIREEVVKHSMPPWYADPAASLPFRNDRRLSQAEIDTIDRKSVV